jgi:hypothetical protein
MHELLTLGSVVLAIVNVGVMWAMAHQWRYAWHSNLALQLLWLPYDYLTSQYGLLGLGVIITFVSLKGAFRENQLARAAEHSQPSHRRAHRRGGSLPRVPAVPASGATASAGTADLPGAEAGAGVGAGAVTGAGADAKGHGDTSVRISVTVPADAAGLAGDADLAHVSVSAGAKAPDRDRDDRKESPPVPRIPQQADRRTAVDNQSRPRLP